MSLYEYQVETIAGEQHSLEQYRGQVLLIVNTASKCGFTPQYDGLQKLYEQFKDQGLTILGFPCDQFMHQEPGDEAEIAEFCRLNYGVTFPMFAKIEVNGAGQHPLYGHLTAAAPGLLGSKAIKWNFTKFLVDRQGVVTQRFAPNTEPADIAPAIEALLG